MEHINFTAMVFVAMALWVKLAFDAGRRKGYLEGRKAVRRHYEQVGR